MFDLSWSHILIVLVVALIVVGPKDLPKIMRMAGGWMAKARAMANEFRKSFDEMARQSELDELRTELEALRKERPLSDIDLHQNILPPDDLPPTAPAPEPTTTPAPEPTPEPPAPEPAPEPHAP